VVPTRVKIDITEFASAFAAKPGNGYRPAQRFECTHSGEGLEDKALSRNGGEGYDEFKETVMQYPPATVAEIRHHETSYTRRLKYWPQPASAVIWAWASHSNHRRWQRDEPGEFSDAARQYGQIGRLGQPLADRTTYKVPVTWAAYPMFTRLSTGDQPRLRRCSLRRGGHRAAQGWPDGHEMIPNLANGSVKACISG